ncbi:ABC transporter permease [Tsukamurella asaccharolytica]|uniref:ABC transporter permease n=1 Tax=Tsukamurella asaccharolytica TaxID=2592067 RepID=UPI001E436BFA|nr:ABC transporter permease subunit [Tsukamurella asaccharolytica]
MTDQLTATAPAPASAADDEVRAALDRRAAAPPRVPLWGTASAGAWIVAAVLVLAVPDTTRFRVDATTAFGIVLAVVAAVIAVAAAVSLQSERTRSALSRRLPWAIAGAVWIVVWELSTAKSGWLAPPYFAAPQQLLYEAFNDRGILARSLGSSLVLLATGFLIGLIVGIATGVLIGWSERADYWVHPALLYLGPVPAIAWIPIVFVAAPTSFLGAVFLIALTVWFPVTLLTRAGVVSTPRAFYDVAQTLGADTRFLVTRISLPSALPSIFTGAFMGLGMSFATLTVAENFGVNAGLGWYINWKKGWSAYPAMYAAILIMVLFCGGLLIALLRTRDRVLRWQKDLTRW